MSFDENCPKREDSQHCICWYDGKPCCSCGDTMTFGDAIQLMKDSGQKVRRAGWNGKGMRITLQKGYPEGIAINQNTADSTGIPAGTTCIFHPYLMMKAADGSFFPWNPNQLDMLSEDWEVV